MPTTTRATRPAVTTTGREELPPEPFLSTVLLDSLPHPLVLVRGDGRVLAANRAAAEIAPDGRLDTPSPADTPRRSELKVGHRTWELWWLPVGRDLLVHYRLDITERLRDEERRRQRHTQAGLEQLADGLAHRVNNPLGSMLLHSELLLSSDLAPQARRDLQVIHDEARRVTRLVTALLTCGRDGPLELRPLDLNRLARKALEMRRCTEKAQRVRARAHLHPGRLMVRGDAARLMEVLMNLLRNAEEALEDHGGGTITLTTTAEDDWARLSVSDDGPGIPPELRTRVFYPFFSTRDEEANPGLGLAICHRIVADHGGIISAGGNEHGGATITVELPVCRGRRPRPRQRRQAQ